MRAFSAGASDGHDGGGESSLTYSNSHLAAVLKECRVVACVGLSGNWQRPSNFAMKYLQQKVRKA